MVNVVTFVCIIILLLKDMLLNTNRLAKYNAPNQAAITTNHCPYIHYRLLCHKMTWMLQALCPVFRIMGCTVTSATGVCHHLYTTKTGPQYVAQITLRLVGIVDLPLSLQRNLVLTQCGTEKMAKHLQTNVLFWNYFFNENCNSLIQISLKDVADGPQFAKDPICHHWFG